jgi:hypothetical protein
VFGRTLLAIGVAVVVLAFVRFLLKQEELARGATSPLVGTWKLIDEQTMLQDGTVIPNRDFSAPQGLLVYDDTGDVAAQLFRPNTAKGTASSDLDTISGSRVNSDYESYFGTYVVDIAHERITRHVNAAFPSENIGKDVAEQFSIADDRLITRSRITRPNGTPATHILIWTRLSSGSRTTT